MRGKIIAVTILVVLTGCMSLRPAPMKTPYVVFFVPGTTHLTPEAEQIVRQAAGMALESRVSKIEVAVPRDTPGGASLVEGRFTAIQNLMSAARVDLKLLARADLSQAGASLPGAADRAEVRLVP
ncbi:MAG TPA: hypothetical protein VHT51_18650 [Micropepsaceae bacterium]|nr:hypothetical protein [Micropepsaceae bacterium]